MTITLTQLVVTVGLAVMIPTLTALIGILVSNGRFSDLSKRIDDLNASVIQHRSQTHSDIQMLIGWEREREKGGAQ